MSTREKSDLTIYSEEEIESWGFAWDESDYDLLEDFDPGIDPSNCLIDVPSEEVAD